MMPVIDSDLFQEIENVRSLLFEIAKEKDDLNHAQVIQYSVLLDELIIKAQKSLTIEEQPI